MKTQTHTRRSLIRHKVVFSWFNYIKTTIYDKFFFLPRSRYAFWTRYIFSFLMKIHPHLTTYITTYLFQDKEKGTVFRNMSNLGICRCEIFLNNSWNRGFQNTIIWRKSNFLGIWTELEWNVFSLQNIVNKFLDLSKIGFSVKKF